MGIAAQTNGKQIEPVWLMDSEFIISVPAVKRFDLRAGAAPEDAHKAGPAELSRLHEENRSISLNQTVYESVEQAAMQASEEPAQPIIKQEKLKR